MNIYIKSILIVTLIFLPVFSALAEDDSCELKKGEGASTHKDTTNEFTADKTWRFKVDKSLINNNRSINNKPEGNSATNSVKSAVNI